MLVKDYMTRHPIMISPESPASKAQMLMQENNVRHLPVVGDGKRVLGLVTRDRLSVPPSDLGSLNIWEISSMLANLKVKDVMVKSSELITIEPDATLEKAAKIMIKQKIGGLPVVEDDIVIGIITEIDLLEEFTQLLGSGVKGVRATIRVPDKIGEFSKLSDVIASHGWGIYASGSVPAPKAPGYFDVVIKVRNVMTEDLISALEKIEDQEIIDVRGAS